MKRNKGFTLIELLAVIVILAIIALIATPIIMNVISESRKSAAVDSAYGAIEGVKLYVAQQMLESESDISLPFTETWEDGVPEEGVVVSGTVPANGSITIDADGKVSFGDGDLEINSYTCTIDAGTQKVSCGS